MDDDDGWRDSKCRSHPLINGCDKKGLKTSSFVVVFLKSKLLLKSN